MRFISGGTPGKKKKMHFLIGKLNPGAVPMGLYMACAVRGDSAHKGPFRRLVRQRPGLQQLGRIDLGRHWRGESDDELKQERSDGGGEHSMGVETMSG